MPSAKTVSARRSADRRIAERDHDVGKAGAIAALIEAALKAAKRAGARALEAYPFDAEVSGTSSSTGYASTFARAGFKSVERRIPARPITRHDLRDVSL